MPRQKRVIGGQVEIDGYNLEWRLHREQQHFGGSKWAGIAIAVNRTDGLTRKELYLEYPVAGLGKLSLSRVEIMQPQVQAHKVEAHIRMAMEAGWDPDSRGKPFVFEVDEMPHD